MATVKKEVRERVWLKYDKKCAYCGSDLEYKQMQIDHIQPYWYNATEEDCKRYKVTKGEHEESNFNPSCARCNRWKSTFSLEQFRNEIQQQVKRLNKYNSNYRLALDYKLITEEIKNVQFYFEK